MQLPTNNNSVNLVEWRITIIAFPFGLGVLAVACSYLLQGAATFKIALFVLCLYVRKIA